MKRYPCKALVSLLVAAVVTLPVRVAAEDIDIYQKNEAVNDNPNVLIVLDNTSNWSRAAQKWPDESQQGKAEVDAIKTLINSTFIDSGINVGLFEFVTEGNASQDTGGKVRYAIRAMDSTNKTTISSQLTTIYNNVTDPLEKRNSGTRYGDLMYDIYNYFSGDNAYSTGGINGSSMVDATGYTTAYSKFKSPLSSLNSCARNFVIFISNPDQSGPTRDSAGNWTTLQNLYKSASYYNDPTHQIFQLKLPQFTNSTTPTYDSLGDSDTCYASKTACNTAPLGGAAAYDAASFAASCADTNAYTGGCTCGDAQASVGACGAGTLRYMVNQTLPAGSDAKQPATSVDCYASVADGTTPPSGYPTTNGANKETFGSCPSGSTLNFKKGAMITANGSCKNKYRYTLSCKTNSATSTQLGFTSGCYGSAGTCSTAEFGASCTSPYTCACDSGNTSTGSACGAGTSLFSILGINSVTTVTPTGVTSTDNNTFNADEWARFMYQEGIVVSGLTEKPKVTTYTIDVYNAQQNSTHTSLMMSMAKAGGGKYFNATNKNMIIDALKKIVTEIQAVNSTFASASLPLNATNRSQSENQVYIGMFRPDRQSRPRWLGNLKRYQIGINNADTELVDVNGVFAINTNTGFVSECATSFWTTDSYVNGTPYWDGVDNPDATGQCKATVLDPRSDSPDGPSVEKGAAAEVMRRGNGASDGGDTWALNRTVLMAGNDGTLGALNSETQLTNITIPTGCELADVLAYIKGGNVVHNESTGAECTYEHIGLDDGTNTLRRTKSRPSVHGDVIHSRPVPVNYGGGEIVIYYGSNDGHYRAVEASTGQEKWSLVPEQFFPTLTRSMKNSPLVYLPGQVSGITPTPTRKNYFWDGSTGVYQKADNSAVWIYPTMRRGGRMIYALDVTSPGSPSLKWRYGCMDSGSGGCVGGGNVAEIGQTWAIPQIATTKGAPTPTDPIAVIGGGYDSCEDTDDASPSCSGAKGRKVFILNANTGAHIRDFDTERGVAADVNLVDVNFDGSVDYAYAADLGGNLYRINFVDPETNATLSSGAWGITKIGSTSGDGRKFQFGPALLPVKIGGKYYVYMAITTGDREHPLYSSYPFGNVQNRLYVYIDDPSRTTTTDLDTLVNRSVDPGCDVDNISPSQLGWYMDLKDSGVSTAEQGVTSVLISSGLAKFSTNRPVPPAAGSCATTLGEARGYAVSLLSGSGAIGVDGVCGGDRSSVFPGGGLPPSPVTATVKVGDQYVTVELGVVNTKDDSANSPINVQKAKAISDPKRKRTYWYSKDKK